MQYKTNQHRCLQSVTYIHCECAVIAMLISRVPVYVLLLIIIKDITGFEKDNPKTDDESHRDAYSSSGQRALMNNDSCVGAYLNYSDCSFYNELVGLTSNGMINITTDVLLQATVQLSSLENFTIIGNYNATVNCDNAGGIHFNHCRNFIIIGITWEKCGNKKDNQPAVKLNDSSNIIIQNCSFQNSVTQSIALSEMSGNVTINGCTFVFNNYDDHGMAIHYLSKIRHRSKFLFTIINCNFTHNEVVDSQSIVYIGPSSNKITEHIFFTNSVFLNNSGTPIYISHQNVYIAGNMLFNGNVGNRSAGIFINNQTKMTFQKSYIEFINNKALYGGALCIAKKSNSIFEGNCIVTFNNNIATYNGGALYIENNSDLKFDENSTVTINNNQADQGGALYVMVNSNITITGISNVTINNNTATNNGGALYIESNSDATFEGNSTVIINNNQADNGGVVYIGSNSNIAVTGISNVTINNNIVTYYVGVLYINYYSYATFEGNSTVTINNNQADNGGVLYIIYNSGATFEGNSTVIINNNQAKHYEAVHIGINSNIAVTGISNVTINNNNGKALYIVYNSYVTFEGNSTVTINNNQANYGGTVYIESKSNITITGISKVTINNNIVTYYGGVLYISSYSYATFEGNSIVTINNNQADYRGAVYIGINSKIAVTGISKVTINNNTATNNGGALYIESNSDATFEGKSTVTINNNQAGAVYIESNSNIAVTGNSNVTINNNQADNGGAVYIGSNSNIAVTGNSNVTINNNQADNGGAVYIGSNSNIAVTGNSNVTINNNTATNNGGALYIKSNSDATFEGKSTVTINKNQADNGGAVYIAENSDVTFKGNSTVTINNNQVKEWGGAIYIRLKCNAIIEGNTIVTINNNKAFYGGAIIIRYNSIISFERNCVVTINNNQANDGGALYIWVNSDVTFKGDSMVTINNSQANNGGALYILDNSNAILEGNSTVTINNNMATSNGGAFNFWYNSDVTFKGNSTVTINNNQAINGGALYIQQNSSAVFNTNSVITFDNNTASVDGGALHANNNCSVKVKGNSTIIFNNNQAFGDGGAIYFNNQINVYFENISTVTLTSNTADNYGGAIYTTITQNKKYFNISKIYYHNNRAGVAGNLLYIDVQKSCNASCLTESTVGISNNILWHSQSDKLIATSPNTLKLHYPAKCISNDSVGCEKYYIDNIMLGQEIVIPACLLDYYNRPAEVTQFTFIDEDPQNYYVYGSQYILISCNHSIEGISIIRNQTIISSLNYSMFLTSHISSKSARKSVVINLTVELSPCYPGFQYDSKSQKCECYNNNGIVYCSGSSSAIKRGYWFGHVTGIPTVTFCPINYCNFTCCKATNGYHQLSPTRNNQCRLHRAGIACGSCENGYTLPYYSSECVNIDKCTMTWTIVIVIITVLYWVAIVAVVFIMMHYQINIGKLYAITYYYSIVDALLSDNSDDFPGGLYTFINIIYSIAKLTPQFLGKLCLVKGISGIDQQFIHYIHPLAVAFILIMITLLARCSHRISSLLSRAIIRVICFLLLLSYTSATTTSLLLLKYLKFSDVTKVYTHLSPDTEYFHGRHLAYGMIAILCTITVVIGLPLLLLLEPFINHKINFTKIKPILDQFQGCYKDKYRWFAAYYMICRLMIISIIIVFTSNDFTARYLLITVCAAIVLVHLMIKPYNSNILTIFDAILLLFLVLATILLLIDFTESNLAIQVTFLLLTLPMMVVGIMCLLAYMGNIKHFLINLFHKEDDHDLNNNIEMSTRNFDIIVNESMRKNATVCAMYVSI